MRLRRVSSLVSLLLLVFAAACGGGDGKRTSAGGVTTANDDHPSIGGDTSAAAPDGSGSSSGTSGRRGSSRAEVGAPGSTQSAGPGSVPVVRSGPRPASEDRTGVTRTSIRIGHHWPKTSHYGAILKSYMEHFQIYFTGQGGVNARGGIGGRKVELVEADDQLSPSGAAAAAKQLEAGKAFLVYGHAGVEQQLVAQDHFERKHIPYVANGLMSTHVRGKPWSFTFLTPWDLIAATMPSFIDNHMKAGSKKIGVIWEQPDWPVPKNRFLAEAKAQGLQIVSVEAVTATQASYVQNVSRVRDSGAQVVVMIARLSAPGILRDARAIGYNPTWTGFGPWTLNLFNDASGGLMEGIKAVRQWQGVDAAKYREYVAHLRANGKEAEASEEGFGGWMVGFFLENVIARAGTDPTRQSLVEGMEATHSSPIPLGVTPPIRYAPDRHWQSEEGLPVQVKDGNWLRIGDWTRRF